MSIGKKELIRCSIHLIPLVGLFAFFGSGGYAASSSPLFSRGYTVIPALQKVNPGCEGFWIHWRLGIRACKGLKAGRGDITNCRLPR